MEPSLRKFLVKEKGFTSEQFDEFHTMQTYKRKLFDLIRIRWHSVVNHAEGYLQLDEIKFEAEQLSRLRRNEAALFLSYISLFYI